MNLLPSWTFLFLFITHSTSWAGPGTPIPFTSAEGFKTKAIKGELQVPVNRSISSSPTTRVSYLKFESLKPGSSNVPLFYFAGGPGSSGIEFAKNNYALIHKLRELSDVIVIDQRGCGGNAPELMAPKDLACPPDVLLSEFVASPDTRQSLVQWEANIKRKGIDLSSFNTLENAADIFDIQKELGYQKINVWGYSYGTHLALAYVRAYPTAVNRMVLGAVNGLNQRVRSPLAMDQVFMRLDSMVRSNTKLSLLFPDGFYNAVKQALNSLERSPAIVENAPFVQKQTKISVGRYDLCAALSVLGNEPWFPSDMPAFFYNLNKGKAAFAGYYVHAGIKSRGLGTAMTYSTHVASGYPHGLMEKIEQESKQSLFGNAINFPYSDLDFYKNWSIKDLGDAFRAPFKSDVPVLMFSGDLDFRTSPEDAAKVGSQFSNIAYIIVQNCNHALWQATPEVGDLMFRFLQGARVESAEIKRDFFEFRSPLDDEYSGKLMAAAQTGQPEKVRTLVNELYDTKSTVYVGYTLLNSATDLFLNLGELTKAKEMALILCERYPNNWRSYQKLGEVLDKLKEGSHDAYKKSLELNPYNLKATMAIN